MALDSVNSSSYTNLQSVLEAARKRTASVEQKPVETAVKSEPARQSKSASNVLPTGGSLFDRLYGAKNDMKQSEPARVGTRFDRYA